MDYWWIKFQRNTKPDKQSLHLISPIVAASDSPKPTGL